MNPAVPRLHAVTNDTVLDLPDFWERVAAVDTAGTVAIHLRSRTRTGHTLFELAEKLRAAVSTLFVNDRVDLARMVAADGVHLPETGMPVAVVRALVAAGTCLGQSTHSTRAAATYLHDGADYVFLGPIWPTQSHPNGSPLRLDALGSIEGSVVVIGGVTAERVGDCVAAGASGVAAIRAIWNADDPHAAAQAMLVSFGA